MDKFKKFLEKAKNFLTNNKGKIVGIVSSLIVGTLAVLDFIAELLHGWSF